MTTSAKTSGVAIGRGALYQLRATLERETGTQAPALLREIGFAAGADCHDRYAAWLKDRHQVDGPHALDAEFLSETMDGFFEETGWGHVTVSSAAAGVLAVDSPDWAEAEPRGVEYPACHLSSGMLADFFTQLGATPAAVMEVECRSRGDTRCRFLVASPELLTWIYERMVQGLDYQQVLRDR